jgi:glutamate---cysteine ligase / carboxylate-amine ligase
VTATRTTGWPRLLGVRTVGIEEELLLVDEVTGEPLALAAPVLRRVRPHEEVAAGGQIERELQQQQIETDTHPEVELDALAAQVHDARRRVDAAARELGARVAALATSPLPVTPRTTPSRRYLAMARRFGLTEAEQLTCGCHVHVAVESDDEGVGVLDRIRPWLPVLTALSANSPYWQGRDSGYASFRTQAWGRWPSAGPVDVLGSAAAYHRLVDSLLASGVPLDEGMVYFDARLSASYPTVEVRVADVCLLADDAVLLAGLVRGLVETGARDWRAGEPPAPVSTAVLRMAAWQASRSGLDDVLVHPLDGRPRPAADVVAALLERVAPALQDAGDLARVQHGLRDLLARGSGARRQRQVLAESGRLVDVVRDAVHVTADELP